MLEEVAKWFEENFTLENFENKTDQEFARDFLEIFSVTKVASEKGG
jgi:hypothetical protein